MATRSRTRFLHGVTAWLTGTLILLTLLNGLDLQLFFTLGLIGFLIALELTEPFGVRPMWRRRLSWIVALGLLVFGYVVVRRVMDILPPGAV